MEPPVETSAAELDAIVAHLAGPPLSAAGFTQVGRRRWVRARPPIRHLFEVTASKGAMLIPNWGISLDFVPHLRGGALAWHRTDKSALADIGYWPPDFDPAGDERWSFQSIRPPAEARRDAERILPPLVREGCAWLDAVSDLDAARARAERFWSTETGIRDQLPLALAFLRARTGAAADARAMLDWWITTRGQEPLRAKLFELLEPKPAPR